jgi:hypothetical protein
MNRTEDRSLGETLGSVGQIVGSGSSGMVIRRQSRRS